MRWFKRLKLNWLECLVLISVSVTVAAIWLPGDGTLPASSLFFDGLTQPSTNPEVELILTDSSRSDTSVTHRFLLVNRMDSDVWFTGDRPVTFGHPSPAYEKVVLSDGEWVDKPIWCGNGLAPRRLKAGYAGRFQAYQHSGEPEIRIGMRCYPDADPRSSDAYTIWSATLRFDEAENE